MLAAASPEKFVGTLKKGLSATDKNEIAGETPLHVSYCYNDMLQEPFDPRVIQFLVKAHPNIVNEIDADGKTPVHYAVLEDNLEKLEELLWLFTRSLDP